MKKIKTMERESILKQTYDNWYGNYEGNNIKLTYHGKLSDGIYRVSCWGNDDFGMEKDYTSRYEAIKTYRKLKELDVINKDDLRKLGFINA